jgi:hypothetical protein
MPKSEIAVFARAKFAPVFRRFFADFSMRAR